MRPRHLLTSRVSHPLTTGFQSQELPTVSIKSMEWLTIGPELGIQYMTKAFIALRDITVA
jgi:hypothetical protein